MGYGACSTWRTPGLSVGCDSYSYTRDIRLYPDIVRYVFMQVNGIHTCPSGGVFGMGRSTWMRSPGTSLLTDQRRGLTRHLHFVLAARVSGASITPVAGCLPEPALYTANARWASMQGLSPLLQLRSKSGDSFHIDAVSQSRLGTQLGLPRVLSVQQAFLNLMYSALLHLSCGLSAA